MTLAVSSRYKLYQPSVSTDTFLVSFPLFADDDLDVYVNGALTSAYSVTATYTDGVSTDATITLSTAVSGVNVEIYGNRVARRETDYLGNSPNFAKNIQVDLDRLTATQQEQARRIAANEATVAGFTVRPEDFAADTDAADNTAALNAWFEAGAAGSVLVGTGTYTFTGVLNVSPTDDLWIQASGIKLVYTGASTTGTKVQFGSSASESREWNVQGLEITSTTTMTDGDFIVCERLKRSNFAPSFVVDGIDGNDTLYRGIYFKNCGDILWYGVDCMAQQEGIRLSGAAGFGQAEYRFLGGRVIGAVIGIHAGGGVGGVYVDLDFSLCGEGMRIDRTISDEQSREFFFGKNTVFDLTSDNGTCINIQDTTSTDNFYVNLDGTWVASAGEHGIYIASGSNVTLQYNGGKCFNHGQAAAGNGNGITNESANATILLSDVYFEDNVGTALNFTAAPAKYEASALRFKNNGSNWTASGRPDSFFIDGKLYYKNNPEAFGAVGDYTTDDTAAMQAWADAFSTEGARRFSDHGGVYRMTERWSLPQGIIINGPGGSGIQPYPLRDNEKDKLRPGFKHTLKGANVIFDGSPSLAAINTNRNDSRTGLNPMVSYTSYEPCFLSGFDIIQDMDVLDAGGTITTAATDNRSTGYDCGLFNRSYASRFNKIGIFAINTQGGYVQASVFGDDQADPDYTRLNDCNIASGVVIIGAHDAAVLTLTGNVTVVAGETLTQATSGATGQVVTSVTAGDEVKVVFTTGTFNLTDELTGSTSGALGANSVPTDVDLGDGGNTGLKAIGCNIYGADHHERDAIDPNVPALYIDGDTTGTNQGIRGHSFGLCAFRGYANIAMDFDNCTYVSFPDTSLEFSTRAGITGLDATGRPRGTSNTSVVKFDFGANTSGFDIQTFAEEITGPIIDIGTGGTTEGVRVIKGGAGTPANVAAAALTVSGAGDPRFQLTHDVGTGSADWAFDMDVDDSDTYKWRWDGTEVQQMSTDGVFGKLALRSGPELTIASGVITPTNTRTRFSVDTEGDAATDDLDTITATFDGHMICLRAQSVSRTVVLKDGTGNLELGGDITLDNSRDRVWLMYESAFSAWVQAFPAQDNAA